MDGQGKNVYVGILSHGSGTIDGVAFKNIVHPGYQGRGVMTVGDVTQALTVKNCTFNNMGRIGVLVRGAGSTVSIENCTYTGKGPGDWLDYAYEASGGGKMTVKGSSATACTGVAYDGSTSAAILATTYWGPGTTATIENCVLTGNTTGVAVGYDATDTSVVSIWRTDLSGNASEGVSTVVKPVVAEENYWGAVSGPGPVGPGTGVTVSTNVDYEPWCNEDFSICGYTAATMTPTTGDALFCVGESTHVNIDIATVANLYGYQFEVTYNKDMASAVGAFVDTFFNRWAPIPTGWNAACATPGTCRFSVAKQAPAGL